MSSSEQSEPPRNTEQIEGEGTQIGPEHIERLKKYITTRLTATIDHQ